MYCSEGDLDREAFSFLCSVGSLSEEVGSIKLFKYIGHF